MILINGAANGQFGAWVVTPGMMTAEMAAVDAILLDVGYAIMEVWNRKCDTAYGEAAPSGCLPQHSNPIEIERVRRSFSAFQDEWEKFKADTGYGDKLWGGTYDKIIEFKKRAIEWRSIAADAGATITSPKPDLPDTQWDLWKGLKKVAIFGVVIAAIYAGAKIIPPLLEKQQ